MEGTRTSTTRTAAGKAAAARRVLMDVWGHQDFRHGQEQAVDAVLSGRDCVAILPTGAGKTAIFQLPARVLGGTTVVVSPLVSLMEDQVRAARGRGLSAVRLGGESSPAERTARRALVCASRHELVYVAPEGLRGGNLDVLAGLDVGLLAIDEAHCVDRWGTTFRADYLQLGDARERLGNPPCVAVTASASPATRRAVEDVLGLHAPVVVRTSCRRPNLRLRARPVRDVREAATGVCEYAAGASGSGIVYTRSRDGADATAALMRRNGTRAESYHARLPAPERSDIQARFLSGELRVVVATVAFGMGIDKPDVRWVLHQGLPESLDAYYQEVGRAGRDGRAADCLLLWSAADLECHRALRTTIGDEARRHAALMESDAVLRFAAGARCRHMVVAEWFGEVLRPCGTACDVCLPAPGRGPGPSGVPRAGRR